MFDFRLKVFHTVAKRLSFTKAADELCITQPAVTKHIKELENHFNCAFFERIGNKIKLSNAGEVLFRYSEKIFSTYHELDLELASLNNQIKGSLKIGASTTIALYVLPYYLALFKKNYPDVKIELLRGNTEFVENLLAENKIDCGLVEGQSKRQNFKYQTFLKDEIVLCTGVKNNLLNGNSIPLKSLVDLSLVLREPGSGSLEVLFAKLKKENIAPNQLKVDMILESSVSIKNYLDHANVYAFLSIHSILKELQNNEIKIIEIENLKIERNFYLIDKASGNQKLTEIFLNFVKSHNLKL